ncbi:hypothetical protein PVAP13_1NG004073 [Panicum virgatum]|uniref:Uncharacterized protein n=1 Tax=Panicum virgatum TaxID=38727 RepID=A0A8T0WQ90_PANVG|nr:hypothetical protein PVAP13_1NG004073 [Panicum virgatum]
MTRSWSSAAAATAMCRWSSLAHKAANLACTRLACPLAHGGAPPRAAMEQHTRSGAPPARPAEIPLRTTVAARLPARHLRSCTPACQPMDSSPSGFPQDESAKLGDGSWLHGATGRTGGERMEKRYRERDARDASREMRERDRGIILHMEGKKRKNKN